MELEQLKDKLPYKTRKGPSNTILPYIDARTVMDQLDKVVGSENWQTKYEQMGDKLFCYIGVKVGDEWIWKGDIGAESEFDPEKGEVSDAFKRAAVHWGVGRFLYSLKDVEERPKQAALPSRSTGATDTAKVQVDKTRPLYKASHDKIDYKDDANPWMTEKEKLQVEAFIVAGKLDAVLTLVGKRRVNNAMLIDLEEKFALKQSQLQGGTVPDDVDMGEIEIIEITDQNVLPTVKSTKEKVSEIQAKAKPLTAAQVEEDLGFPEEEAIPVSIDPNELPF